MAGSGHANGSATVLPAWVWFSASSPMAFRTCIPGQWTGRNVHLGPGQSRLIGLFILEPIGPGKHNGPGVAVRRNDAIRILRSALPVLRDKYGVKDLALFGSVARDEATSQSDVDILVTFNGPATFDGFLGLEETLESLLGGKVDLVTDKALKPLIRPSVERDLIHVA